MFFYGATYQKSQSAVFMLSEKGIPSLSRPPDCTWRRPPGRPRNKWLDQLSLQLSSEQSVGDVGITKLDWKRVPQARSRGCKSSVAVTAECSRHHASRNVSRPQRAPSAVGHARDGVCACIQAAVVKDNYRAVLIIPSRGDHVSSQLRSVDVLCRRRRRRRR